MQASKSLSIASRALLSRSAITRGSISQLMQGHVSRSYSTASVTQLQSASCLSVKKHLGLASVPTLHSSSTPSSQSTPQMPDTVDSHHFRIKRTHPSTTNSLETSTASGESVTAPHRKDSDYTMDHHIWSDADVENVQYTHRELQGTGDYVAYGAVKLMRTGFDFLSGYNRGPMSREKWLNRFIFLETVAGVPGMVAAMTRHLLSLGRMRRDYGWIHTLLEEAENERMHLLTFLQMKQPGIAFRAAVLGVQAAVWPVYFVTYLTFPRVCHRFVGYLEEEAVYTYTKALADLDRLHWAHDPAPTIAKQYWQLGDDATIKDLLLAVRADEANHRDVNHELSTIGPAGRNPF